MPTSLNSLLGGIFTGASGFSGRSGYSGTGSSGFSGAGVSGFSGYSGAGGSGFSGFSGGAFNGGTITNPLFINNATAATSAGNGALQVLGGVGIGGNLYLSITPGGGRITGPLIHQGSVPAIAAQKYVLQGDVSVSSSTVAINLSGASFSLGVVGAVYYFKFFIIYSALQTTNGLGAALTFPGANETRGVFRAPVSVSGAASVYSGVLISSGVKVQAPSVPAINNFYMVTLEGTTTVSAIGTLQLQVYSALTGATTTNLTVRRGTSGWIWRMQ